MKKVLSVLIALAMVLSLMPAMALAAEEAGKVWEVKNDADNNQYYTLQYAVQEADAGDTIILLEDVTDGTGVIIDKSVTIDLGGHTYTFASNAVGSTGTTTLGFQILKNNVVTIENGTLTSKSGSNIKRIIQNYADLTLANLNIYGENMDEHTNGSTGYTVSFCNGVSTMTNVNITKDADAGDGAISVATFDSYPSVKLTVNSGTYSGGISCGNTKKDTLIIKGGVFTDLTNAVKYAEEGAVISLGDSITVKDSIVVDGITLNGNHNTLTVENAANDNTNYGILTTGGTIQDLTIRGASYEYGGKTYGFRAIMSKGLERDLKINGVDASGATYGINISAGNGNDLIVEKSSLGDWNSYDGVAKATFTGCAFTADNIYYTNLRVYDSTTTVEDCTFELATAEDYQWTNGGYGFDNLENKTGSIHVVDCKVNGAAVTAANVGTKFSIRDTKVTVADIPVTGVTLDKAALSLKVGETGTLTAAVAPENATDKTVTWTSSNESVATVEGGTVTAKAAGTATITAAAGGFSATCEIEVATPVVDVTGVTLDKATLSLKVGETGTLAAAVAPESATDKTVTWTSSNESVATVEGGTVTAKAAGTATITAAAGSFSATCTVTVTAKGPTGGGLTDSSSDSEPSGGSSSTPSNPTVDKETTNNTDGSTTVTETKKDGTTVETTTKTDGSTVTTETKTEVKETATSTTTTTTTETVSKDADGNKETVKVEEKVVETATATTTTTKTETKTDAKTETVEVVEKVEVDENGNETVTTTATTETKLDNGSTGTTTVAADGTTTAEVKLTTAAVNNAAKAEEAVTLPMPEVAATKESTTAPVVTVNVPSGVEEVTVEIPVADVTAGTVAVIVHADGTEEVVKTSTITENGVALTVEGNATVKIVDNSKDFTDVPETYALSDSIDFVSARGLFEGNTETTFNPHANTTVAQTMTVLARLEGEDFYGAGSTAKGAEWAAEKGLDDGGDVQAAITREQMVVMMWKLAGSPESDHEIGHHADDHLISDHAVIAMRWAVEMGIIQGNLDGTLNPKGYASRAHVAAFSQRYVKAI